jgi:hypothetical protein
VPGIDRQPRLMLRLRIRESWVFRDETQITPRVAMKFV